MELWVRSQNKEKLIKINNIEVEHYYSYKEVLENYMPPNATSYDSMKTRKTQKKDKYIKSVIRCNNDIHIGEYKTEKRALEVLDEIQKYLIPTIQMLDETIGDKQVCQIGNIMTFVYEMPKE